MLVCLLMMVGAAGRGGGLEQVYLIPYFVNELGIPIAIAPGEGGMGPILFVIAFLTATATGFITIYNLGGLVAPVTWGWISDHFPRKPVMQVSLLLSAVATFFLGRVTEEVRLARPEGLEPAFWLGGALQLWILLVGVMAFYGLVVHSRQAITQAMVGDYAGPELEDAAFSLYFTIGFLSAPIWTIVIGAIMQGPGFTVATEIKALSYLAGMLLLIPLRVSSKPSHAHVG
jgi:MFS family permease